MGTLSMHCDLDRTVNTCHTVVATAPVKPDLVSFCRNTKGILGAIWTCFYILICVYELHKPDFSIKIMFAPCLPQPWLVVCLQKINFLHARDAPHVSGTAHAQCGHMHQPQCYSRWIENFITPLYTLCFSL